MSKCFAHRGFSGKYPENTMLAFEKALEAGAEGMEFDVQLSADGIPVIMHDETLDRTTDGTGFLCHYTYDQLERLDARGRFKEDCPVQRIPTLDAYLRLVKDRTDFITNIELKTSIFEYAGIEQKVLDLIDQYGLRKNIIISSFNHYTVKRFKEMAPDVATAFLGETWIIGMGAYSKLHGNAYVHPIFTSLISQVTEGYAEEIKANGVMINTWTVNEKEHMIAMLKLGIEGVITNYPDLFLQVRSDFEQGLC